MIPFLIIATTLCLASVIAADEAFPSIPTTFYVAKTPSDDLKPIHREVYGEGKIFDITHRYTQDIPVWESSEGVKPFLRLTTSMKNQSLSNTSEMKLSVHTGTHLDAPGHFHDKYYDAGFDSDSLDLQVLNDPLKQRVFDGFNQKTQNHKPFFSLRTVSMATTLTTL
ncbi:unnamed protein product [Brassica rapa subsp. narinosa]